MHGRTQIVFFLTTISLVAATNQTAYSQPQTDNRKATIESIDDMFSPDRRAAALKAQRQLRESFRDFFKRDRDSAQPEAVIPEAGLPEPQRRSLAEAATNSFQQPEELHSVGGVLKATLLVMKAHNRIGDDPVYLRSYNGRLVGPTLRVKPGDTLKITLKNDLAPEPDPPGHSNSLHGFNTTNLHTHGLHVSPSGISDNILLSVPPGATQDYEIKIPADHPCGTFWYHAHKHGSTAAQVASGMAGALIVSGGIDELPGIREARERVFMLQQISYLYKNCFPKNGGGETCFDLPEGVIEEPYVNFIFGPGSWDPLGRYTTVNGVELPVIRVRPGSVERWRLVHSGVRERIELKLESAANPGGSPSVLPLHEIAVDGLPLGRISKRDSIELWPGYRSDALVQFPNTPGAEYLLVDERTEAAVSMNGNAENRKYIARVIIEGEPQPMNLPSESQELKDLALQPIKAEEVTGQQSATYGILLPSGGIEFTVDGKPYDPHRPPRKLTLGDVDEWTLKSKGDVGAVSHPFHIHVNPFEVYSILDDQGRETLENPVWRDTIVLHGGWTVKARSRYTAFTGTFVNHCHILDHEDQGMMQLVEIVTPGVGNVALEKRMPVVKLQSPYSARQWKLPDATGAMQQLSDFKGQPVVLLFFQGHGCLHCAEQLAEFSKHADAFKAKGVKVVGISTDTLKNLRQALKSTECPFTLVADPDQSVFRSYGCFAGGALHGTFVLDAQGRVQWQCVSSEPFMDVQSVLSEIGQPGVSTGPLNAALGD